MSKKIKEIIVRWTSSLTEITDSEHEAEFELRQLLAFVIKKKKINYFDFDIELEDEQIKKFEELILKRMNHEPIQYIIGEWEFMGLPFYVSRSVLIPRQDSELLAEIAISFIKKRKYSSLLDLCTGSGCVGVSISKRTSIPAVLGDISSNALEIAKKNVELNDAQCSIVLTDMFDEINGSFDVITINPPYIKSSLCHSLQKEVLCEPLLALDGGNDGLDFYRRISDEFQDYLNSEGVLMMEIGFDQAEAVSSIFKDKGVITVYKDISNNDRVISVEMSLTEGEENADKIESNEATLRAAW